MLQLSDFKDAEKRCEFYTGVVGWWDKSRADLIKAMDECPPLAWEVYSMYSDLRDILQADIELAENEGQPDTGKIAKLREKLASMPEEPEEGAKIWLLNVNKAISKTTLSVPSAIGFPKPPIGARTKKTTCHGRLPPSA
jgi:hypothetical protein